MAATQASATAPRKFYGWNNAVLMFLIHFAAAGFVIFAYPAIFPTMVEEMNWNRGSASIAYSVGFLVLGFCYPLTAWMIGKWGVRLTLQIGLLTMLSGLLMVIFVVTEIWQWTIVWGLVMGLSFALTGPIIGHTLIIHWFNVRRATVLGIIVTGSAFGGFLAQPVLAGVMGYFGNWQSGWMTSVVLILFALLLSRLIINRPADVGQHPDNIDPQAGTGVENAVKPRTHRSSENWTIKQVFTTHTVYLMMTISVTYLAVGTFLLTHGALHLNDIGISKLETASLMGIFILGSGVGRIPAGILGDRIELRWLVAAIMGLMFGGFILFASAQSFALLGVSGFLIGICYGGKFALAPAMISNFFGEESFAKINATFAPILLPFVAVIPAGAGFIFEAQGSYDMAFQIGTVLLILSFVAAILLKPPALRTALN